MVCKQGKEEGRHESLMGMRGGESCGGEVGRQIAELVIKSQITHVTEQVRMQVRIHVHPHRYRTSVTPVGCTY